MTKFKTKKISFSDKQGKKFNALRTHGPHLGFVSWNLRTTVFGINIFWGRATSKSLAIMLIEKDTCL